MNTIYNFGGKMGYFLEGFKARVNDVSKWNYERALTYIHGFLLEKSEVMILSELAQKEYILRALKVIMSKELGLSPEQVSYIVKQWPKNVNASILRIRGDGNFRIVVNENNIAGLTPLEFMNSILHEFGHLDLILREQRGESVPYALFTDNEGKEKLSDWQKAGVEAKYRSNNNELYANLFAARKAKIWINECRRKEGNNSNLKKRLEFFNFEMIEAVLTNAQGRVSYGVWSAISKILRIKESDCAILEPCSSGVPEIVIQFNESLAKAGLRGSIREAYMYVRLVHEVLEQSYREGTGHDFNGENCKLAFMNYQCMILADRLGLDIDSFGFCIDGAQKEKIEYIDVKSSNPNSILQGYFSLNSDMIEQDMSKFVVDVYLSVAGVKHKLKNDNENQQIG